MGDLGAHPPGHLPRALATLRAGRRALRPPGDDEQLARLASRILAEPLDRRRPLWDVHLIEGYRGTESALVCRVHHCMIDGVSGVHLMGVLFDTSPNPAPVPPPAEAPSVPRLPTAGQQLWRAVRDGA